MLERCGTEGIKLQLMQHAGFPKAMLLQEEVNIIVTDTILNISVGAAPKIVKEFLRDDQQVELMERTDKFYT